MMSRRILSGHVGVSRPRRESFEHFYLTKIALAEGCGCAEHVTRMRDVEDAHAAVRIAAPSNRRLMALAASLLRHLLAPKIDGNRKEGVVIPDPGTGS